LLIQNEDIKLKLNDTDINEKLNFILNSKRENKIDSLLEYQSKAFINSLKNSSSIYSSKKIISLERKKSRESVITKNSIFNNNQSINISNLKEDDINFLKNEREVKIYTDKGEIKKRILNFNENLNQIICFKRLGNKFEIFDTMRIDEIDSCLRSCSHKAFSMSFSLFSKKPSATKCFTIFGYKTLSGQKSLNIECSKEEDCIKYVDFISILISNYKSSLIQDTGRNSIVSKK
jgi:hypothetical protein